MLVHNTHIIRRQIAGLLHEVADPEIPVVSIVDLGMVIDIRPENGHWRIDLAPTYSGCPAIDVIPIWSRQDWKKQGYRYTHRNGNLTSLVHRLDQ